METLRLLRQVIGGIYYMSLVSFADLLKVRRSSEVFPSGPFHGGLVFKPNTHFHRLMSVECISLNSQVQPSNDKKKEPQCHVSQEHGLFLAWFSRIPVGRFM